MRYRTLGGTGIEVSVHCLGTMMFGAVGNPDHDDCVRIIHAALDQGINFVDTADMYSAGESEEIVGKALRGRRDDVVLATKVHFPMGEGRNRGGNSRRWILTAVEESLRRLGTDWIDLYQIHRPDHSHRHRGDAVRAERPRAPGKIRAFGCSTFPAEEIVEAHHVAERRGLQRFRTEQPPYSILARGIEASVLPVCQRYGMGVLTWSPLASGFLSGQLPQGPAGRPVGRPRRAQPGPLRSRRCRRTSPSSRPSKQLVELADRHRLLAARARGGLHRGPSRGHLGRSSGRAPWSSWTDC